MNVTSECVPVYLYDVYTKMFVSPDVTHNEPAGGRRPMSITGPSEYVAGISSDCGDECVVGSRWD